MADPIRCPFGRLGEGGCTRLGARLRALLSAAVPAAPSDLEADCRAVALLALQSLRLAAHLRSARSPCAYCIASVTYAVRGFPRCEGAWYSQVHSLEDRRTPEGDPLEGAGTDPGPEAAFAARLPLAEQVTDPRLLEAWSALTARERAVLELVCLHGCTPAQAAARLGITPLAGRLARHRGLRRLRGLLQAPDPRKRSSRGWGGE